MELAAKYEARPYVWRGIDLVLMTIISLVVFIGGIVALMVVLLGGGTGSVEERTAALLTSAPFSIATTLLSFLALSSVVLAARAWRKRSWAEIGLRPISWRWVLAAAGLALALRLLVVPLTFLIQALGISTENPQMALLMPNGFSWGVALALLLLAGIAVPFAEELFFRGVLYTWLRERWGVAVGTLVSALVFALVHGTPLLAVLTLPLGITTALVYERSRSLLAAFVVHAVFNCLGLLLLYGLVAAGVELPGVNR